MVIEFSPSDVAPYEDMRMALAEVDMAATHIDAEEAIRETLLLVIAELQRTNRRLRAIEEALGGDA